MVGSRFSYCVAEFLCLGDVFRHFIRFDWNPDLLGWQKTAASTADILLHVLPFEMELIVQHCSL